MELLCLHQYGDDGQLKDLPLLPDLRTFKIRTNPTKDGDDTRFVHLAELLHRQAGTLEEITWERGGEERAPFEEPWPQELPVCKRISMESVSSKGLRLLSKCRMPQLETLELETLTADSRDVPAALGWLRSLPALKNVFISDWLERRDVEAQREALRALLQGTGVTVA